MAISKQLVELMNGTIDVELKVGNCSTFTVKIPPEGQSMPSEPSDKSLIIGIYLILRLTNNAWTRPHIAKS